MQRVTTISKTIYLFFKDRVISDWSSNGFNQEAVSKVYLQKNGQNIIWLCALYVPFFVSSCDKLTTVNALGLT